MNINEVLHNMQTKMSVPKDKNNTFGGFKYRSVDSILKTAKSLLPDGYFLLGDSCIEAIGDSTYIVVTYTLSNGENSISSRGYAKLELGKTKMTPAQETGACTTYATKYALGLLLGIDDGSYDPDSLGDNDMISQINGCESINELVELFNQIDIKEKEQYKNEFGKKRQQLQTQGKKQ